MKKKIVFFLPALGSGGAERVTALISRELVAQGRDVEILLLENVVHYNVDPRVKVVVIGTKNAKGKLKRMLHVIKFLRDYVKSKNVVLIPMLDTCLRYSILMKLLFNARVVACERNNPYGQYLSFKTRFLRRRLFDLADYAVFQTPDAQGFYSAATRRKSVVIPNPVTVPERRWRRNDNKALIILGRLHKQKNLPLAIDALKLTRQTIPNATLTIYGEGDERANLEKYVAEKNLQDAVFFRGTTKDVWSVLAEADGFILSSDFEGISNAMLEALAFGMPVAVTDCPIGGARMTIKNGVNGILTPVGDARALADATTKILTDGALADALGVAAREAMQEYAPEKIAGRWLAVVEKFAK